MRLCRCARLFPSFRAFFHFWNILSYLAAIFTKNISKNKVGNTMPCPFSPLASALKSSAHSFWTYAILVVVMLLHFAGISIAQRFMEKKANPVAAVEVPPTEPREFKSEHTKDD